MKTLLVLAHKRKHAQRIEQQQNEAADKTPRVLLLDDTLHADLIDGHYLQTWQSRSRLVRLVRKFIPDPVLQAFIVYRRHHHYDAVVTLENDAFALFYAFLSRLLHSRPRFVAILGWPAAPKKALILKCVQRGIDRILVWTQSHRDLLVELFNISPSRIGVIRFFADCHFWRPMNDTVEGICSVGDSSRDYATLVEAISGLDIPCCIATRLHPGQNCSSGNLAATSRSLAQVAQLPDNIVLRDPSLLELRDIYARSRFVVVPLFPTFQNCGITVVIQAMAMGRAIICSRTLGMLEFIEEGVNGMFVPPADPKALRAAIQYLWEHPDVAARMGAAGRRTAEEKFTLESFADNARRIVEDVITSNP